MGMSTTNTTRTTLSGQNDEYLRYETTAEYMETCASRCRKRTFSIRVATQRFESFARHPMNEAVITRPSNVSRTQTRMQRRVDVLQLVTGQFLLGGMLLLAAGLAMGEWPLIHWTRRFVPA